jgi:hypothetical protein
VAGATVDRLVLERAQLAHAGRQCARSVPREAHAHASRRGGNVKPASVYNPSIERPLPVSVMPVVKVPTAICSSLDRRRATVRYPTSIGCAHDRASVVAPGKGSHVRISPLEVFNYFAAWYLLAVVGFLFIGIETRGRTIEELDAALARPVPIR